MTVSATQIEGARAATGFRAEPVEKVLNLLELLDALRSHPYLGERLVLKGGTALNLLVLDMPRLSVDVDMNYVGAADRETMLSERPRVEEAVRAVCSRLGLNVRHAPDDHAGGKWRLSYGRAAGGTGTLELDLNFLLRTPLWPPVERDSLPIGVTAARRIRVLDVHELAAGKLAALFGRQASRDLFDAHALFNRGGFDRRRLRLAFVLYGAMNRRDWRTVSIDDVRVEPLEADQQLVPLLRHEEAPNRQELAGWCDRLNSECRSYLADLLPFEPAELEFLELINTRGEIAPDRLTDEASMQELIRMHPALQWKALNVRRHMEQGD